MKIQNLNDKFQIEDKRFRSPFIVKSNCSKCGDVVVKDMRNDYIGYPIANDEFDIYFYHECADEGDHEWTEKVILRVRLEAAPSGDES